MGGGCKGPPSEATQVANTAMNVAQHKSQTQGIMRFFPFDFFLSVTQWHGPHVWTLKMKYNMKRLAMPAELQTHSSGDFSVHLFSHSLIHPLILQGKEHPFSAQPLSSAKH